MPLLQTMHRIPITHLLPSPMDQRIMSLRIILALYMTLRETPILTVMIPVRFRRANPHLVVAITSSSILRLCDGIVPRPPLKLSMLCSLLDAYSIEHLVELEAVHGSCTTYIYYFYTTNLRISQCRTLPNTRRPFWTHLPQIMTFLGHNRYNLFSLLTDKAVMS